MTATPEAIAMVLVAAKAASDKLGRNIVAFDVSEQLSITDAFVLASANNERQVGAIVDAVEEAMIVELDRRPARREGERENRWVLLDYVDVVVHVQHAEDREQYSLERLWRDCPAIDVSEVVDEPPADSDPVELEWFDE